MVTKFSDKALTKTIGARSDIGGRKEMEQQATGSDAKKRNTKIQQGWHQVCKRLNCYQQLMLSMSEGSAFCLLKP